MKILKQLVKTLPLIVVAITLTGCSRASAATMTAQEAPWHTIEVGAYGFDAAIVTNIETGEVIELVAKEVLKTNIDNPWWWLIKFNVRITQEDIFYNYELTKGGRTYTLVADNTLSTHTDEKAGYTIEVIMGKQKIYG